MKTIKIFLLFWLGILMISCCKDSAESIEFSPVLLLQTRWAGTLKEINRPTTLFKKTTQAKEGITFFSDGELETSFLSETVPESKVEEGSREYTVNGKIIHIGIRGGGSGYFEGSWFITYFDGKKMVLEKGSPGEGAHRSIMELTKIE